MAGYVPNPDDPTQPTGGTTAQTAAAEFRAIKEKLLAMTVASGSKLMKRQCPITGPTVSGLPSHLVLSATALGVDIKAGAYYSFAYGFTSGGAVDYIQAVSVDITNAWGALPQYNTNILAIDYNSAGNPTPVKTLAFPQVGTQYDQSQATLLSFGGAALGTTFLDSFGNTWAAQGTARIQNSTFKFGTGGLGGNGAGNSLNGTTDYIKAATLNRIWTDGWSIRGWAYMPSLPTAGNKFEVACALNAANFGVDLYCYNNAGTIRWGFDISSNGAANNVANAVVGTSTPTSSTWYFVELTFDKLAGIYRLYVNGIQEQTVVSALQLCPTTQAAVGARAAGSNFFAGYIDKIEYLPYCDHPNGTTYTVPTSEPLINTQGYAQDFFSLIDWKLYQVSAESTAAGANPTFTSKQRLYIGEADTSNVAVTALRPYAYNGYYEGQWVFGQPNAAAVINNNTNIGTRRVERRLELMNLIAEGGYVTGDIVDKTMTNAGGTLVPVMPWVSRNNCGFTMGSSAAAVSVLRKDTGAALVTTQANWAYRLVVDRSF